MVFAERDQILVIIESLVRALIFVAADDALFVVAVALENVDRADVLDPVVLRDIELADLFTQVIDAPILSVLCAPMVQASRTSTSS